MITILGTDKVIKVTDLQLLELQMFILYVLIYEQLYTLQKIIKSFASIFILTLFTIVLDAQKSLQNELKKIYNDITKYK